MYQKPGSSRKTVNNRTKQHELKLKLSYLSSTAGSCMAIKANCHHYCTTVLHGVQKQIHPAFVECFFILAFIIGFSKARCWLIVCLLFEATVMTISACWLLQKSQESNWYIKWMTVLCKKTLNYICANLYHKLNSRLYLFVLFFYRINVTSV